MLSLADIASARWRASTEVWSARAPNRDAGLAQAVCLRPLGALDPRLDLLLGQRLMALRL